jgi:hypothetical protein
VKRVGATHTTGLADYRDVVVTEVWTPLGPETIENKSTRPASERTTRSRPSAERWHRVDRVHARPLTDGRSAILTRPR